MWNARKVWPVRLPSVDSNCHCSDCNPRPLLAAIMTKACAKWKMGMSLHPPCVSSCSQIIHILFCGSFLPLVRLTVTDRINTT